jgi:hypothetical protein
MEQQSDSKLDALFQKAAEEYPLKTNNKNWDIVSAKLHAAPASFANRKSRRWKYSVLIVLFLAGSFFVVKSIHKKTADILGKQTTTPLKTKNGDSRKTPDISTTSPSELSVNRITEQPITVKTNPLLTNTDISFQGKKTSSNINLVNLDKEKVEASQQPINYQSESTNNLNSSLENLNHINNNPVSINKNILVSADKSLPITNESNSSTNKANEKSIPVKFRLQPKTFYGMFFFSPDFSTVKFQHVNKPGYSIGIALGYRINTRLSAEIGLQRLHANFYSNRKYVDTSNLKPKSAAKHMEDLNGNNKITQVPIGIKYNLLKNNNHLFVTAGTTVALLMHAEKYDYNIVRNGSSRDVQRKFSAVTGTKFFSSINFSLGYQAAVTNIFNIKVEPYYQAATKGLGVGKLPISNFGVNIGIIKDIK